MGDGVSSWASQDGAEMTLEKKVVTGLLFRYSQDQASPPAVWEGVIGFKCPGRTPYVDPKYTLYASRLGNGKAVDGGWDFKVSVDMHFFTDEVRSGRLQVFGLETAPAEMSDFQRRVLAKDFARIESDDRPAEKQWGCLLN